MCDLSSLFHSTLTTIRSILSKVSKCQVCSNLKSNAKHGHQLHPPFLGKPVHQWFHILHILSLMSQSVRRQMVDACKFVFVFCLQQIGLYNHANWHFDHKDLHKIHLSQGVNPRTPKSDLCWVLLQELVSSRSVWYLMYQKL